MSATHYSEPAGVIRLISSDDGLLLHTTTFLVRSARSLSRFLAYRCCNRRYLTLKILASQTRMPYPRAHTIVKRFRAQKVFFIHGSDPRMLTVCVLAGELLRPPQFRHCANGSRPRFYLTGRELLRFFVALSWALVSLRSTFQPRCARSFAQPRLNTSVEPQTASHLAQCNSGFLCRGRLV